MDTVLIIVLGTFLVVGLSFFVGRKSKENDELIEKHLKEQKVREKATEIEKSTANLDSNNVRDELRDNISK